jgi:hypothetical protein
LSGDQERSADSPLVFGGATFLQKFIALRYRPPLAKPLFNNGDRHTPMRPKDRQTRCGYEKNLQLSVRTVLNSVEPAGASSRLRSIIGFGALAGRPLLERHRTQAQPIDIQFLARCANQAINQTLDFFVLIRGAHYFQAPLAVADSSVVVIAKLLKQLLIAFPGNVGKRKSLAGTQPGRD